MSKQMSQQTGRSYSSSYGLVQGSDPFGYRDLGLSLKSKIKLFCKVNLFMVTLQEAPLVLAIITFIGKHKPINDLFPHLQDVLERICVQFISQGTTKQAKQAVKCLYVNVTANQDRVFSLILDVIKDKLNGDKDKITLTVIVALGHLAFHLPEKFPIQVKNLVSKKIVKDLMMKDVTPDRGDGTSWCCFDDLCLETQCKVEGMKMIARWLLSLRTDEGAAQKTFKLLHAVLETGGDLLEEGKLNLAERAWLRLSAGCAILKICEQKVLRDKMTLEQYYTLSNLMTDPVLQVREKFLVKLHKGLGRAAPLQCLPLDFMAMYVLAGLESDNRLRGLAKQFLVTDIKTLIQSGCMNNASVHLPLVMPENMLRFAVLLLTHYPGFTLQSIKHALVFILDPLIHNENYSFCIYRELIQKMKHHRDAHKGDIDQVDFRLWAVCDLAMGILITRTTNLGRKKFLSEIPPMYSKAMDDPKLRDIKSYLPSELQHSTLRKTTTPAMGTPMDSLLYSVSVPLGSSVEVEDCEPGTFIVGVEDGGSVETGSGRKKPRRK